MATGPVPRRDAASVLGPRFERSACKSGVDGVAKPSACLSGVDGVAKRSAGKSGAMGWGKPRPANRAPANACRTVRQMPTGKASRTLAAGRSDPGRASGSDTSSQACGEAKRVAIKGRWGGQAKRVAIKGRWGAVVGVRRRGTCSDPSPGEGTTVGRVHRNLGSVATVSKAD